jgi:RNA polymerase-binding transcription factor DksA
MSALQRRAARSIPAAAGPARGPAWRALLEAQWRARLQEVTELSLAYHEAAAATAAAPPGRPADRADGRPADRALRQLLRRAIAARRALADTEEALGRLASGRYGLCEGCTAAIPARMLAAAPDARYCPRCRPGPAARAGPAMAGGPALGRRPPGQVTALGHERLPGRGAG